MRTSVSSRRRAPFTIVLLVAAGGIIFLTTCAPDGEEDRREMPTQPGPAATGAVTGELALTATVANSHLFVDGRFVGETAAVGSTIAVRLSPGEHELRVTARGHADLASRIDMPTAKRVRVRAPLVPVQRAAKAPAPGFFPLVGVGQTVRTAVFRAADVADASASWRFIAAAAGERVLIATSVEPPELTWEIRPAEDEAPPVALKLVPVKDRPGVMARRAFAATLPEAGEYHLTATSTRRGVSLIAARLCRAPPPLIDRAKYPNSPLGRRAPPTHR